MARYLDLYLGEFCREDRIRLGYAFVVLVFQNLVVRDFLERVCHKRLYKLYVVEGARFLFDESSPMRVIPAEFAMAGFRFGHSMVRTRYDLNSTLEEPIPIEQLFLSGNQLEKERIISNLHIYS